MDDTLVVLFKVVERAAQYYLHHVRAISKSTPYESSVLKPVSQNLFCIANCKAKNTTLVQYDPVYLRRDSGDMYQTHCSLCRAILTVLSELNIGRHCKTDLSDSRFLGVRSVETTVLARGIDAPRLIR